MKFTDWFEEFIEEYDWESLYSIETSAYFIDMGTKKEYWKTHLHILRSSPIDDLPLDAKILDIGTWFGIFPFALKQYGFTNVECTDRMSESDFKRISLNKLWKTFDITPFDLEINPGESIVIDKKYDLITVFESNIFWKTKDVVSYDGLSVTTNKWQVVDKDDTVITFFAPFKLNELKIFNDSIKNLLLPGGIALIHFRPWIYNLDGFEKENLYINRTFRNKKYYNVPTSDLVKCTDYYVIEKDYET